MKFSSFNLSTDNTLLKLIYNYSSTIIDRLIKRSRSNNFNFKNYSNHSIILFLPRIQISIIDRKIGGAWTKGKENGTRKQVVADRNSR